MRFVDPHILSRIGNLELVARRVVEGFISGLHRAVHLGVSTDFAEHRLYTPGDDLRRLDWRVYARTDRLFIKTFEAETNADLVCVLDISRSMDFTSHALNKLDYARFLAASLTHLGARQRDRVALAAFDHELREWVPPAARHRDTVMRALDRLEATTAGEVVMPLRKLASLLKRRSIVVVISDFYAQPGVLADAFAALRAAGHDLIVMQILDPLELDFSLEQAGVLDDLETGERVPVDPGKIRHHYLELVREHTRTLESDCARQGIDFQCLNTSQPLDHALFRYLSQRARLARVR